MLELKLTIETDAAVGTKGVATNVLRLLNSDHRFTPDRFGYYEPLKNRFDVEAAEVFVDAWVGAASTAGRLASFHFTKRKAYQAAVMWTPGGWESNSVYFNFRIARADDAYLSTCLQFGKEMFDTVQGQYGHLCTREEFYSKNMADHWIGPTGAPEGGRALGTDRSKELPGVYWANFFGPAYVEFFGSRRLQSAPAYATHQLPHGWLLLTADSPLEWDSPETKRCENELLQHLGSDAFFSREAPDRRTRAPVFNSR